MKGRKGERRSRWGKRWNKWEEGTVMGELGQVKCEDSGWRGEVIKEVEGSKTSVRGCSYYLREGRVTRYILKN